MTRESYTWEDLDKAWWEGFDNAKNKMEKRIEELEKENAGLKARLNAINLLTPELEKQSKAKKQQLTNAKEILAKLLEEEKNNMYWEMNGSDKSSYYEVRKRAEQFLEAIE